MCPPASSCVSFFLPRSQSFKVHPEVLCVGQNKSYNVRVYVRRDATKMSTSVGDICGFEHVSDADPRFQALSAREKSWYIVG